MIPIYEIRKKFLKNQNKDENSQQQNAQPKKVPVMG